MPKLVFSFPKWSSTLKPVLSPLKPALNPGGCSAHWTGAWHL